MQNLIDKQTQQIIDILRRNSRQGERVFLVGGIVRDLLLKRSIHDFDISYQGDVSKFAKKTADVLGASYFMLNETFQTARIIFKDRPNISIDIVGMRGNSIDEDLRLRDFTINAMALDVQFLEKIIDPCKGAEDLNKKILRVCSESSFKDDPVRILRAIRQSIIFNLRIEKDTLQLLKESSSGLLRVSPERMRDELMRIMDLPNPVIAINLLEQLKLIDLVVPEVNSSKLKLCSLPNSNLNLWDNTIQTIKNLTSIEHLLLGEVNHEDLNNLRGAEISLKLGRYKEHFKSLFQNSLNKDRSIHSLLILTGMFKNIEYIHLKESTNFRFDEVESGSYTEAIELRTKSLALSNKERKWCISVLNGQRYFHEMSLQNKDVDGKDVYQYFQLYGESGIFACLLALAETLTYQFTQGFDSIWNQELQLARVLLEGYWEKNQEWVNPPVYINGHELLNAYPGLSRNQIGFWLGKVKQATAAGLIKNKEDAKNYLKESLANSVKHEQ